MEGRVIFNWFLTIAVMVGISFGISSCVGCGSPPNAKPEGEERVRGNVSRVFLHDPSHFNWYDHNYATIPGHYSVLCREPDKSINWSIFNDTKSKVVADVEKGAQMWFEATLRSDKDRRGDYKDVTIHITSEAVIERAGSSPGGKFGWVHHDD